MSGATFSSSENKWADLAATWTDPNYVRLRFCPVAGHQHYLVLSDLRNYLERFRTDAPIRILDYGSGPSPYRALFPNSEYRRADYVPSPGLAYVVDRESRVPEQDAQFDFVLSTQVAEHLANPTSYLREAFRLLRPGGRLVLTTHGIWPDHGTPYDFQRWTAAGLARDITRAGFTRVRTCKLTAGYRGHAFLALDALGGVRGGRTWIRNLAASSMQRVLRPTLPWLHRRVDKLWPQMRIVDLGDDPCSGPSFYIIVAAEAERPLASPGGY